MPTATLRTDLTAMLGAWRSVLPAAWRPGFDGVELPFDQIPATLAGGPIWPKRFFHAFEDMHPDRVRAVIFGNDPYTKIQQATGRSFEQGDVTDWKAQIRSKTVSPSLRNIVIAAVRTQPGWRKKTGLQIAKAVASGEIAVPADLFSRWAAQGVLWLNRTLTFSVWEREDPRRPQAAVGAVHVARAGRAWRAGEGARGRVRHVGPRRAAARGADRGDEGARGEDREGGPPPDGGGLLQGWPQPARRHQRGDRSPRREVVLTAGEEIVTPNEPARHRPSEGGQASCSSSARRCRNRPSRGPNRFRIRA